MTMNSVLKDLNETKLNYERQNALLIQQLSNKKKDNNDEKDALQRSAFKMLEEYNKKQNATSNLKRKNNIEEDGVIETSNNKVNDPIVKKKKKSKIDQLLEEDEDDASVAYSNFTNETEYSQRHDLDEVVDEITNVAKAAAIRTNCRSSPRKQNSKPDSNHEKPIDVVKVKKTMTKNKGADGEYLLFLNILYNHY